MAVTVPAGKIGIDILNRCKVNLVKFTQLVPIELNGLTIENHIQNGVLKFQGKEYLISNSIKKASGYGYYIDGTANRYPSGDESWILMYCKYGYFHNIFEGDEGIFIKKSTLVCNDPDMVVNEPLTFIFGFPFSESVSGKIIKLYEQYKDKIVSHEQIKLLHEKTREAMTVFGLKPDDDDGNRITKLYINERNYEYLPMLFGAKDKEGFENAKRYLEDL